VTGKARSTHNTDLLSTGFRAASPFADPDAERLGYPKRRVPPCMRRTPNQVACRVACAAPACVYLRSGVCPWPAWASLSGDARLRFNGQWPYDGSGSGRRYLSKRN